MDLQIYMLSDSVRNKMHTKFRQRFVLFTTLLLTGLLLLLLHKLQSEQIRRHASENNKYNSDVTAPTKKSMKEQNVDWNLKEKWQNNFQMILHKYHPAVKNMSTTSKCLNTFKPNFLENINIVDKYSFKTDRKYLREMSLDDIGIKSLMLTNGTDARSTPLPVIVTAATDFYFLHSQGLIQTYHTKLLPLHKNLKLIFYDMGLKKHNRDLLVKYCKCEVRTFPKEKFPEHVYKARTYTWKPIIIQLALKEFEMVLWADSSIRFLKASLTKEIQEWREKGIQAMTGSSSPINTHTKKESFEYLGEDPCLYDLPEIQTGLLLVHRNKFVLTSIMKPWVSCALSYNCMTFDGSFFNIVCFGIPRMHQCHRFDQSIFSIIVTRLFNKHRSIVENSFNDVAVVRRSEPVNYFLELELKKAHKTS